MPSLSNRLHLNDIIGDRIPRAKLAEDCLTLVGAVTGISCMYRVLTFHPDDLPDTREAMHEAMEEIRESMETGQWGDRTYPGIETCRAWTPIGAPQFDCATFDTFKWDAIKARLEAEEAVVDEQNDDHLLKSLYLGSILNIAPSGQYRAPWSGAKPCPLCKGVGSHANVLHDESYLNASQRLRTQITKSNFDKDLSYADWSPADKAQCQQLDLEIQGTAKTLACPFCSGDGSRIRVEDADFMEYLEGKADEFGAFITGSDGDGCDVLIQKCVPRPEAHEDPDAATAEEPDVGDATTVHDSNAESEHVK